jgi:hypothetical protein
MKLTEGEAWQIKVLIKDNIREGYSYGRKDYWDKRNQSILKKLKEKYND